MRDSIVVLEDNLDRIAVMSQALEDVCIGLDKRFFRVPMEMIAWLRGNLSSVAVASLDHDMNDLESPENDQTGMQVAEHLAASTPSFPVIIHTTNDIARAAMAVVLKEKGWKTRVVVPYEDTLWIREIWIRTVKKCRRQ